MRFPNAAKGVKNIFTAQILQLIGSGCAVIGCIILISSGVTAVLTKGSDAGLVAALSQAAGASIFLVAYSILALIAFIMQIVGIVNAKKDEESFKSALICLIIGIVVPIIGALFSRVSPVISSLCLSVGNLMGLFVTIFIISGIIKLADQLNRGDVSTKGSNILKMIIVIAGLSLILSIVSSFMMANTAIMVTAVILIVVSIVLSIIQYIMFLTLLSQAKKMLNEG